jgi:hypothetical protein
MHIKIIMLSKVEATPRNHTAMAAVIEAVSMRRTFSVDMMMVVAFSMTLMELTNDKAAQVQ